MFQKTISRLVAFRGRAHAMCESADEVLLRLLGVAPQALSYSRDVLRCASQPGAAPLFCGNADTPSKGAGCTAGPSAPQPSGRGVTSFAHSADIAASSIATNR